MLLGRLTGLVLAAAIGVVPLAPPEHAHESHDPDHHGVRVHRHSQGHTGHHHAAAHDQALEDDDAPVMTVQAVLGGPVPPVVVSAPIGEPVPVVQPPSMAGILPTAEYVELLIHGPPRAPASLRAPPSFLAS
jgi:hypothetical protein